jgi:hypothetical protein
LPEKDRRDIEAEIRSMVEDSLDERKAAVDQPREEKLIAEVLEELGDPKRLAEQYAPPKRYLIGPAWYEGYLKVLQRVLFTALPVFAVVTYVLRLTKDPLDFVDAFGEAVGGAFGVGVQIVFWVTLVFVFLERSGEKPGDSQTSTSDAWTVAQLPETPGRRQIPITETVMNIAFVLFFLIWIALPFMQARFQEASAPVPFLHPDLWDLWLPILFVLMGLSLVHELFKLKIGNWTPALTITNVILGLGTIVFIVALVLTQQVINPAYFANLENNADLARLRDVAAWGINFSAAVIAGIYVWDIVNSLRLSRQRGSTPPTPVAPRDAGW